jgi:hypothetical protein
MLGAMAFFMMASSYRASATETLVYKCSNAKGQISYQDFACKDNQKLELLKLEINQSADTQVGLRDNEKIAMARLHEKQMLRQALNAQNVTVVYHAR